MSVSNPKICVVMPVYNGGKYLREAIDSILAQSYDNFEFIIIDDGSTDNTWMILNDYDDVRIQLVRNEENIGMAGSLNKGLALARGEFIARMDADDVSLPERLEKQVRFLNSNPHIGAVGSFAYKIDASGRIIGETRPPTDPYLVEWGLCFDNYLCHPTFMFRKSTFTQVGGYSEKKWHSEDYDLWSRMVGITRISNLPDRLLLYRHHQESVGSKYFEVQKKMSALNTQEYVSRLIGKQISTDLINKFRFSPQELTTKDLFQLSDIILDLYALFRRRNISNLEFNKIKQDAARRLVLLALESNIISCRLVIFFRGFVISPVKAIKVLGSRMKRWIFELVPA